MYPFFFNFSEIFKNHVHCFDNFNFYIVESVVAIEKGFRWHPGDGPVAPGGSGEISSDLPPELLAQWSALEATTFFYPRSTPAVSFPLLITPRNNSSRRQPRRRSGAFDLNWSDLPSGYRPEIEIGTVRTSPDFPDSRPWRVHNLTYTFFIKTSICERVLIGFHSLRFLGGFKILFFFWSRAWNRHNAYP